MYDHEYEMYLYSLFLFIHILKTGGTSFGRHLVRDLDLKVSYAHLSILVIVIDEYSR